MSNIILTIGQLKKHFVTRQGIVKAVDGISFFVEEGETFGLVGESGSGKSTVAYTVVGMYRPTEGKIIYRREDISRETKNRSHTMKKEIQIVFQDPGTSLNPTRSIKQILEMPLKVHNISKNHKDRIDKIKELLEIVQLPVDYMYKYPSMIGGGEKQMVAIARALATNPSLVLLDEPTSALDVSVQAKIINMLIQFQKKFKLSYLFITHDLSLMRNVASRVAIMYLGKICEIAPSSDFFKNPLHPYTQMLLSSIPVISDEEEALKPKKIMSTGEIPSPVDVPPGCSFHLRCLKKMDVCSCEDPIMVEVSGGHTVRCHLYTK
ncbi:MAG: ABC transporter ATP-binding protein [Candidatus Heimdallarchaeota archaeon]|nr:MAG: ABC transporter ATP-binding protein [Candidatus Heimdallarchaeota archaeon]